MFLDEDFFDLIKSASFHKYVKRTGGPGNYKYWYKLPDGRLVSSDDPAASEHGISPENAKKEHLLRLMLGKHHGHHSMSEKQMADHVGVPQATAHSITQNFRNRGLRTGNHGFEEHHWKEAHHANPEDAPSAPAESTPAPALVPGQRLLERSGFEKNDSGNFVKRTPEGVIHTIKQHADGTWNVRVTEGESVYLNATRSDLQNVIDLSQQAEEGLRRTSAPAPAPASEPAPEPTPAAPRARRPRTPRAPREAAPAPTPAAPAPAPASYDPLTDPSLSMDEFLRRNSRDISIMLRRGGFREYPFSRGDNTIRPSDVWKRVNRDGSEQFIYADPSGEWKLTTRSRDSTPVSPSGRLSRLGESGERSIESRYHRAKIEDAIQEADRIAGAPLTPAPAPAPAPVSTPTQTPEQAEIERLRSALRELDPALHESLYGSASTSPEVVSQSQQRAREAKQRAQAAASPSSPEAAELHEADPSLRAADEAIARMEEAQRRGENPYFTRAKEIYNNIRGDLKPERREKIGHILSAIEQIRQSGSALTEQSIVAKYNEITGRRTREFPHDDFEPSTYMTLDEVIANAPLDVEVERMKRGYAAKQFTRLRPYLKDAWVRSNPSAPPPMPTFGDIKSWGEHGGPKPEWAGNTRLAMPREVFDAAVKGADGKVKYPPAWMPLHLMPAWNYIVKKAESAGKLDSEYRGRSPIVADQSTPTGWNIDAGTTAGTADGIAMNALRKYVKMRGGAEQLTDIPKTKLAEMGLSHAEIFKADADSDEGLKQVIRHKIVDPVALLPFIKEEMKSLGVSKSVKQTFSLVVDKSLAAVTFKKENELKKSQLIKKIRALKAKRS